MNQKVLFLLYLLSILPVVKAGEPKFQWARRAGGPGADLARSIVVDDSGNTYTTGTFPQTIDLDMRKGTVILTSSGETDIFILKLNAKGDFVWAFRIGGPSFESAYQIAIDKGRNVFITGSFTSTVDFDPGPGVFNLTSNGSKDIYIVKLDGAGNFIWAKTVGGKWEDEGYGICTDSSGNAYVTGYFRDSVDLDPGKGVLDVFSRSSQVLVLKFNSTGDLVWGKTFQGDDEGRGFSIKADFNGNVFINGDFSTSLDFDPDTGKYIMNRFKGPSFICKLDNSGKFIWAVQLDVNFVFGSGMALDEWGNVYTTGFFVKTVDFDPGPEIYKLICPGIPYTNYAFVLKLDAAGRFIWAKSIGSSDDVIIQGYGIAIDVLGGVLLTGTFGNYSHWSPLVDFDPGPGKFEMGSNGYFNIFISKLDASGNFIWAKKLGGNVYYGDFGCSIAVDTMGNIYSCGFFRGKFDFDPGSGITDMEAEGETSDIYMHKMGTDVFDTAKYIQFSDVPLCKVMGVQLLNHSDTFIFKAFRFYFGDGDSLDFKSRQTFVQHNYQTIGKYKVTLKAFNKHLGWVSTSEVVVTQPPLSAYFTIPEKAACSGDPLVFTDSSFIPILNKDSFARHWWNFGDGSAINWQSPYKDARRDVRHPYQQAGAYKVTQIISNGYCKDTFTRLNEVNIFTVPEKGIQANLLQGCSPLSVTFHAKYPGQVNNTYWSSEADHKLSSKGQDSVNFVFQSPGTFRVFMQQYGKNGCTSKDTILITVLPGIDKSKAPVMIYTTVTDEQNVKICWLKTPNASHYDLYRDNNFLSGVTDTLYKDLSALTDKYSYKYRIYAKDVCGSSSFPSNVGNSILLVAHKDAANTGLLAWNPYYGWKYGVAETQVRNITGNNDIFLGNLPDTSSRSYADHDFMIEGECRKCYRIKAIENGNLNASSESNIVCIPYESFVWVPTAITINGDGINEFLKINTYGIPTFTFSIYTRWGEKVFETSSILETWQPLPEEQGIYMYVLKAQTNYGDYLSKGTITVLR